MSPRHRGLTLLEVLIALAIFAMAAILLGGSYVNVLAGYEAANRAVDRNEHLEFVRALVMSEPDREVVERGGDMDLGGGRRLRWQVRIELTETPDVHAVLLSTETTGQDLKQPEKVVQRFRLLRPTWDENGEAEKLRTKIRERIQKLVEKS